jgi:hypothetical protein
MDKFFPLLTRRKEYVGAKGVSGHRRYRAEVAEDCQKRCVYCDAREVDIGGDPMMELDHFRPEALFDALREEPTNLVYACRSCNGKKRHDWPAGSSEATHVNGEGYIDPFAGDRRTYFRLSDNGDLEVLLPPAGYMIRRMALNRPLLRCLRRRAILLGELRRRISAIVPRLKEEIEKASPEVAALLRELLAILQLQQTIDSLL